MICSWEPPEKGFASTSNAVPFLFMEHNDSDSSLRQRNFVIPVKFGQNKRV